MSTFAVRPANKREIKEIAAWLLQEGNKDSRFANVARNPLQRFTFRRWVLPRYLHAQANTLILEQDGRNAGFAVIEQGGEAVTLSEFLVRDGFEAGGLLPVLARTTEELARDREYRYARVAPLDSSQERLAVFRSTGYELVDYYLWSFTGELAGSPLGEGIALEPLSPTAGLEQRIAFLRQELDASQTPLREMIESTLFPRRPPTFRSWSIVAPDAGGVAETVGYLSLRPNERHDGVLSVAASLQPALWGSPLEVQVIAGAVHSHSQGQSIPVRVMISTSSHADRAEAGLVALGLQRRLDDRPILGKEVRRQG
ncbi:MAG: hypothetical protein V9H69_25185 [Anaerolineae bacterium]|jgi:hypothetical protein